MWVIHLECLKLTPIYQLIFQSHHFFESDIDKKDANMYVFEANLKFKSYSLFYVMHNQDF